MRSGKKQVMVAVNNRKNLQGKRHQKKREMGRLKLQARTWIIFQCLEKVGHERSRVARSGQLVGRTVSQGENLRTHKE